MSKRGTRPFNALTFPEKVAAAGPTARAILLRSLDDDEAVPIVHDVATLIGDSELAEGDPGLTADEYAQFRDRMMGATALGVALGMLLSPAFGGGR